ncbi:MAG: hypothetical protein KTR35_09490 [Gammaproteobacteria bacterium]|nr:hypothetical protein [Gammaproteobacteria bacterium]
MYRPNLQYEIQSSAGNGFSLEGRQAEYYFDDEHNRILAIVQDALRSSNILLELSRFLSQAIPTASTHATVEHAQQMHHKSHRMLRLKNASSDFCAAFTSLTDKDLRLLDDLKLKELIKRKTWLKLLLEDRQSKNEKTSLSSVHTWLQTIYEYEPIADTRQSAKQFVHLVTDNQISKLKLNRESALFAFLSGTLAIGIALLILLTAMPSISFSLQQWSSTHSVEFKSIIAILLVILTVLSFQLITRVATPLENEQVSHRPTASTSILGDLLNFRVSRRRMIAGCLGPLLLGCGTGFSASAGFGAFGVTVMLDGLYQTYNIPFWVSQLTLSTIFYMFAWKWAGIPLGLGTIPAMLFIGPSISMAATLAPQDLSFIGNSAAFLFGTLVLAIGIALMAAAALGPDARTAMLLAAEKKHRWPIPRSNFFFNLSPILIGIALSGNFGVATILNLILVPPLLARLVPPLRRYLSS